MKLKGSGSRSKTPSSNWGVIGSGTGKSSGNEKKSEEEPLPLRLLRASVSQSSSASGFDDGNEEGADEGQLK